MALRYNLSVTSWDLYSNGPQVVMALRYKPSRASWDLESKTCDFTCPLAFTRVYIAKVDRDVCCPTLATLDGEPPLLSPNVYKFKPVYKPEGDDECGFTCVAGFEWVSSVTT